MKFSREKTQQQATHHVAQQGKAEGKFAETLYACNVSEGYLS